MRTICLSTCSLLRQTRSHIAYYYIKYFVRYSQLAVVFTAFELLKWSFKCNTNVINWQIYKIMTNFTARYRVSIHQSHSKHLYYKLKSPLVSCICVTPKTLLQYFPNALLYTVWLDSITALRWMIPPMVVHPEKIDFRRFV